ncbi:MAG: HWE histidine kinase domain-containing protein [Gemmatimonas sp.]
MASAYPYPPTTVRRVHRLHDILRQPLRVLLYSALIVPWLFAAAVSWEWHREAMMVATANAEKTAGIVREHLLRVVEAQEATIEIVDNLISGLSWDEIRASEALHRELQSLDGRAPHIGGIYLIGPDGRFANASDVFPMPATDVGERGYFRDARNSDGLHIGRLIEGRRTGNLHYTLSRRRSSQDGSFEGVIVITVAKDYLETFWQSLVGDAPDVVALLRADGNLLARYPKFDAIPPSLSPDSSFFSMTRESSRGTFEGTSVVDGHKRIYAFEEIGGLGVFAAVGVDRAAVLAPWMKNTISLVVAAGIASALLSAFIVLAQRNEDALAREIARRAALEKTLVAREEHLAALERADFALRASEKKFRSLFEKLKQGVLIRDSRGIIVGANTAAERIFGNSIEEMTGETPETLGWAPLDGDGEKIPVYRHPSIVALRTGREVEGALMSIFNPVRAERRWIVADAIPLTDATGSTAGAFSIYSDVTEQRRAEEAERLLTREVDHRAKNTLAVVQAIVRLSRAATFDEFVASVEGRIHALASVHTLLARSRWSGADLRSVIEVELAAFRSSDDRISISGPGVRLRAEAAQPVAMVIHELATNAAKYGALSPERPDARLSIDWTYREGRLRLRWRETGVPIAAAPKTRGFGDRLVRSSIESQLGGSWTAEWTRDGLDATMMLPPNVCIPDSRAMEPKPEAPSGPAPPGLRILLAEDNAIVAAEMSSLIEDLGDLVIGPATTRDDVVRFGDPSKVDIAVLDVDLGGVSVVPAAETLVKRNIPVIFCTGYSDLPGLSLHLRSAPILHKPVSRSDLVRALGAVMEHAA